jgi:hypothetical protein
VGVAQVKNEVIRPRVFGRSEAHRVNSIRLLLQIG